VRNELRRRGVRIGNQLERCSGERITRWNVANGIRGRDVSRDDEWK